MTVVERLYEELKDNRYFNYFEIKEQHDHIGWTREQLSEYYDKRNAELKPYINKYENPYMKISNYESGLFHMFQPGDRIVIQEKIDGSNSHLIVSSDGFSAYSQNCELNEKNNLQGYWFWCKDHYMQVPEKYYGLDIYGEWLTYHHCEYPADKYGEFYVFDVMEKGEYWPHNKVVQLAEDCGFKHVPTFYVGEFQSWRHLVSFVGQTAMGGVRGEGVVVKNQTHLNDTRTRFYVKIVDTEYQETNSARKSIKTVNINEVLRFEEQANMVASVVTEARVRKLLLKMIDNNELASDWYRMDTMPTVKKLLSPVYRDCMAEEPEVLNVVGKGFGKYSMIQVQRHVRSIAKKYLEGGC